MKRVVKYLFLLFVSILFFIVIAVFIAWQSIDASFIKKVIIKNVQELQAKKISFRIDGVSVKKNFPSITIKVSKATLSFKNSRATIYNIIDTLQLLKIAISKIVGRPYVGNIEAEHADVYIACPERYKETKFIFPEVPTIPVDLSVKNFLIKRCKFIAKGRLKIKFNPLTAENELLFAGTVNNLPTKLKLRPYRNGIYLAARVSNFKYANTEFSYSDINLSLNKNGLFNLTFSSPEIMTRYLVLKRPIIKSDFTIDKFPIIDINNLSIKTENGFSVEASGKINLRKIIYSELKGNVSTPFLKYKNFINLIPKKLKPYISEGEISLNKIQFYGRPSANFIKKGVILARNFRFRVNTKNPYFYIRKAVINIKPSQVIVEGNGFFGKMKTQASLLIIKRRKGYPCDMHFQFYGLAENAVKAFIEDNILSPNDLAVLGKTYSLKGEISATVDIHNYTWRPFPLFGFNIRLHLHDVELKNENIPGKWIKSNGFITISRITKNGRLEDLFVVFKDFKAQTKESTFLTKKFKLNIQPEIGFYGSYNALISHDDLLFLTRKIKPSKMLQNVMKLKTSGFISGAGERFKFSNNMEIKIRSYKKVVKLKLAGSFEYPKIFVSDLFFSNLGSIRFSGIVNIKQNKIIKAKCVMDNLSLSSINRFTNVNLPLKAIISGYVNFNMKDNNPFITRGALYIRQGVYRILRNIKVNIKVYNDKVSIYRGFFTFYGNEVLAEGDYNLLSERLNMKLSSKKFVLNLAKLIKKEKTKRVALMIRLPKQFIKLKFTAASFVIKDGKRMINLGKVSLSFKNNRKLTFLNFSSKLSNANLNFNRITKTLSLSVQDRIIWPFLTKCNSSHNSFRSNASLASSLSYLLSLKDLKGILRFKTTNGCINSVPSTINIFSIFNPFKTLLSGLNFSRGIAYKEFKGKMYLRDGVVKISENNPAVLVGKTIDVFAYGKYNIFKGKVDAYVTFITLSTINSIVSKIPIIGWILGGKEKSFTGLSFHVRGNISHPSVKPIPLKNLAKGIIGIIKRTLMLPLNIFGVK